MITNTLAALMPWSSHATSEIDAQGFKCAQRLAFEAAVTVGKELQEGWTEKQAAELMGTYLKDSGVKAFFHEPYAWFGDRTRFDGINRKKPLDFAPTDRRLKSGDPVILDVAPIVEGYVGDIGYALSLGPHKELENAMTFLRRLRADIPKIFAEHAHQGGTIWKIIDNEIRLAGYDNIHKIYPFHVLGHRLRRMPFANFSLKTPVRFSLHSVAQILAGGFFAELLNADHDGPLQGFWAIEPHVGGDGFGAKFEEVLVVDDKGCRWLDDKVPHIRATL